MSFWKDQSASRKDAQTPLVPPASSVAQEPRPAIADTTPDAPVAAVAASAPAPARAAPTSAKESLIAADLTIEGKIEGSGHIRIAGRFKGDVNVQGDLTIESGARLSGGVRADKVIIAGELEGNIESASRVELHASGALVGDVKAGSMTVAAGARMRGQADFGGEEDRSRSSGRSLESDAGA